MSSLAVTAAVSDNSVSIGGGVTLTVTGGTGTNSYAWTHYGTAFATTQNLSGLLGGEYICTVTSGSETVVISTFVIGREKLLAHATLNGTLALGGSLTLGTFANATTTLGTATPSYAAGPHAGTQGLAISAATQYLELPYAASLNFTTLFSAGGWFYSDTASTMFLSNVATTPTQGFEFFSTDTAAGLRAYSGGTTPGTPIGTAATPTLNGWTHWWMVYNLAAGTLTLYQNGVSKGSGSPAIGSAASGVAWQICNSRRVSGAYNMSSGRVADLRWYSGCVTAARAMMALVITPGAVVTAPPSSSSIGATTVLGGTAPYTVLWTSTGTAITGQDLTSKTALAPGAYTVRITDANGISTTHTYHLASTVATVVVNSVVAPTTTGNNGSITLTASGGATPYRLSWTYGGAYFATAQNLTGLYPGVYTNTLYSGTQQIVTTVTVPGSTGTLLATAPLNGTLNLTTGMGVGSAFVNASTTFGTPTYSTGPASIAQGALVVPGTTATYLDLPYSGLLNLVPGMALSFGGWFFNTLSTTTYLLANLQTSSGNTGAEVLTTSGTTLSTKYYANGAVTTGPSSGSLARNIWTHIWLASNGTTVYVYLTYVQLPTGEAGDSAPGHQYSLGGSGVVTALLGSTPATSMVASNVGWRLLGSQAAPTTAFAGKVADVRFYSGMVGPQQAYSALPLSILPGAVSTASAIGQADGSIGASTVVAGSGTYTSFVWTSSVGATQGLSATAAAKTGLLPGTYTLTVTDTLSATAVHVYTVSVPILVTSTSLVSDTASPGTSTGSIGPIYRYAFTTNQFGTVSPSPTLSTTYTVECWFKITTQTTYGRLWDTNNGASGLDHVCIYLLNTGEIGYTNDGTGGVTFGYLAPTGTWVHMALAVTGTSLKLYINGALSSTRTVTSATVVKARTNMYIGRSSYTTDPYFQGPITAMRLWSTERTASEIATNYRSELVGTETGLLYNFGNRSMRYTTAGGVVNSISTAACTMTIAAYSAGSLVLDSTLNFLALSGGSGTYTTYTWTGSTASTLTQNAAFQTGLLAGTYTCVVGDSSGLGLGTQSYVVNDTPALVATPTITPASTLGVNGAVSLEVSGGAGFYTYAWTHYGLSAGTTQNLTGLFTGEYICTVTSGTQTLVVRTTVTGAGDTLLAQAPLNGTLTVSGSLGVSFVNAATTYGTATYTTGPSTGTQGLEVSTGTKYLELPYSASLNIVPAASISLGGWFYNTLSTTTYLMANVQTSPSKNGFEVYTASGTTVGTAYFNANTGTQGPNTATLAPLNRWVHIWLASNGTTVYLYLSGVLAGSVATTSMAASNAGWRLMNHPAAAGTTFGGRIADMRWYSGFVSPARAMNSLIITPGALTTTGIGATTVSGGTAPYTVLWTSAGSGSSTITTQNLTAKTGLAPGFYTIRVTDANALTTTYTYQLCPVIVATPTITAASTGFNGAITLVMTGGSGAYSCAWTHYGRSAGTTQNLTSLASGEYLCTVTSGNQTLVVSTTVPGTDTLLTQATLNNTLALTGTAGVTSFQNAGTTLGTPSYTTGPITGTQAVVINTTSKYLELPYTASLNFNYTGAFSVGGWFNASGSTADLIPFSNVSASNVGGLSFYTHVNAAGVASYVNNSPVYYGDGTVTWSLNTWSHWWTVYDGSVVRLYRNGVLFYTSGAVNTRNFTSTTGWQLVKGRDTPSYTYTGSVADVRWYSGVVSAARAMQSLIITPGTVTVLPPSSSSIGATTVSGGTAPYTVLWTSAGSGSSTISTQDLTAKTGLSKGFYTLKVTDASALSTTYTYEVYGAPVATATVTAPTNGVNGAITLAVSGGYGSYSYAWTHYGRSAGTTQNLTGLFAGDYICTVTSGGLTVVVSVNVPATDTLLTQATLNNTLALGGTLGLAGFVNPTTTMATGTPTYVTGPITGTKGVTLNETYLQLPYNASLAFSNAASFSFGGWINQTSAGDSHAICNNPTQLAGLPLEIWNGGGNVNLGIYNSAGTRVGLVGDFVMSSNTLNKWRHFWGTYNGTTMSLYVDGVLLGSTTANSYAFASSTGWQLGKKNFSTLTFSGAIADVRWYSGVVSPQKAMFLLVITPGSVTLGAGSSNSIGTSTVSGGTPPYTYAWTSTGTAITTQDLTAKSSLSEGFYTLKATDANGLSITQTYHIAPPVVVSAATSASTGMNGSITLTVSGGTGTYSYAWISYGKSAGTTQNLSSLSSGEYQCTVTSGTQSVSVTALVAGSDALLARASFNGTLALTGGNLGLAFVNPATSLGATATYTTGPTTGTQALVKASTTAFLELPHNASLNFTYLTPFSIGGWYYFDTPLATNAQMLASTTAAGAGLEVYKGSANLGFTNPSTATYYQAVPTAAFAATTWTHIWVVYDGSVVRLYKDNILVFTSAALGTKDITSTQGWLIGKSLRATGQVFTGRIADVRWYSGIVSPAKAMAVLSFVPGTLTVVNRATASSSISAAGSVTGGTQPYTVTWTSTGTPITSQDLTTAKSGLSSGTYTVSVTDATGLRESVTYAIDPVLVVTTASVTAPTSSTSMDGAITVTASGGSGAYSYAWSSDGSTVPGTTQTLTGLYAGTYSCTVVSGTQTVVVADVAVGSRVNTLLANAALDGSLAVGGTLGLAFLNPATSLGGTATYTTGPITGTQALVKPSTTAFLELPHSASLNFTYLTPFSLGGWYYFDTPLAANAQMLANTTASSTGLEFYKGSTSLSFANPSTSAYYGGIPASAFVANTWTHLWAVYDGTVVRAYKDNVLAFTSAALGTKNITSTQGWLIGKSIRSGTSTQVFTGRVADVRWYSGVVSPQQARGPAVVPLVLTPGTVTPTNFGLATGSIGASTVTGGSGTYSSTVWTSSGTGATTGLAATLAAKTGLKAGTYTLLVTDSLGTTASYAYTVAENTAVTVLSPSLVTHTTTGANNTGAIGPTTTYSFNGSTQYGSIVQSSGSSASTVYTVGSALTMEVWAFATSSTQHKRLFELSNGSSAQQIALCTYSTAGTFVTLEVGTSAYASTFTLPLNTWTHLAFTLSGTALKWYVNGVYVSANTLSAAATTGTRSLAYWGQGSSAAQFFSGSMTGLRLWSTERTSSQISTLYSRLLDGTEAGLVFTFGPRSLAALSSNAGGGGLTLDTTGTYSLSMVAYSAASVVSNTTLNLLRLSGGSGVYASTYTWTGSTASALTQNAQQQSGLLPGTYTCVMADSLGATVTQVYTVLQALALVPGAVTNVTSTIYNDGAIAASAVTGGSGGTLAAIVWSSSAGASTGLTSTLDAQTALLAGTYTLFVRDATGNLAFCTYTVNSPLSYALTFPGVVTSYAQLSAQTYGPAITLELWVYMPVHTRYTRIFEMSPSVNFALTYLPNLEYLFLKVNNTNVGSGYTLAPMPLSTWTHICVTLTSSGASSFYMNGVLKQSITAAAPFTPGSYGAVLGMNPLSLADYQAVYTGLMSEVRIWSVARSASEVADNYRQSLPMSTPNLQINITSDLLKNGVKNSVIGLGGTNTLALYETTAVPVLDTVGLRVAGTNVPLQTLAVTATSVVSAISGSAATAGQNGSITVAITGGTGYNSAPAWTYYGAALASTALTLTGLYSGDYTCTVTSGNQTASVTVSVPGNDVLLAQLPLSGNLVAGGSLGLALVNTTATLGTTVPVYSTAGPQTNTNTSALTLAATRYLQLPYSPALNFDYTMTFSFGGWIYMTSTGTSHFIGSDTNNASGIAIEVWNGGANTNVGMYSGGTRVHLCGDFVMSSSALNKWRHYWVTHNGTTMSHYVDGVLQGTVAVGTAAFTSSDGWIVGSQPGSVNTFAGRVADVRWYSGLVSPVKAMRSYLAFTTLGSVTLALPYSSSLSASTVSGGVPPYTVQWTSTTGASTITAQTLEGKSNLLPGSYTVQVTDATKLTASATFIVPALLEASATAVDATTGQLNGSITLTVTGGTGTTSFSWQHYSTTVGTTQNLSGLYSGEYVCTAVSGTQTVLVYVTVGGTDTLLQMYGFNGTLNSTTGTLGLALSAPTTTLGTALAAYTTGPTTGTQGLVLASTSAYLALPYNAALSFTYLTPFSFGGWFYFNATLPANLELLANTTAGGAGLELYKNSTSVGIANPIGSAYYTAPPSVAVAANTWAHYWVVYDGSVFRVYKDKVLVVTSPVVGNKNFTSTQGWLIGRSIRSGATAYLFSGRVADVRWYSGLVSPDRAACPLVLAPAGSITVAPPSLSSIPATTLVGGVPPYTVKWSSTAGGSPIYTQDTTAKTGLRSATYTVRATDSSGTSVSLSYMVPALLVVTAAVTDATAGLANGAIALTVTGGLLGTAGTVPTYAWTFYGAALAGTTAAQTALFAGEYACTVVSGTQTASVAMTVGGAANALLVQAGLNGNLTLGGTLGLTGFVDHPSTALGTAAATYSAGPFTGTQALAITAATQYLELPYSAGLNFAASTPFSAGGWFYTNSQTTMYLSNDAATPVQGWEFFSDSIQAGLNAYSGGSTPATAIGAAITPSLNVWTHWWLVYSGTTVTLYMNGVAKGSGTPAAGSAASGVAWQICNSRRLNGTYNMSAGRVSDVRWYSGMVSPQQAQVPIILTPGTITVALPSSSSIAATLATGGALPYTVQWTSSAGASAITTQDLATPKTGLKSGAYSVSVQDAYGVSMSYTYVVPEALSLSALATDTVSGTDGSIALAFTGGTATATTFAWSFYGVSAGTTQHLSGLMAGDYTCTVTSGTQVKSISVTVSGPEVLLAQLLLNGSTLIAGSLAQTGLAVVDPTTTLGGAPAYNSAGPLTGIQSLVLAGAAYLQLPYTADLNFSQTSKFSLGGWVFQTGTATSHWLSNNGGTTGGLELEISTSGTKTSVGFYTTGSSTRVLTTGDIGMAASTLSQWHHYWAIYTGTELQLYVDGVLVTSKAVGATAFTSTAGWQVGGTASANYTGRIADVRWYQGIYAAGRAMKLVSIPIDITVGAAVHNTVYGGSTGSLGASTVTGGAGHIVSTVWLSSAGASTITDPTLTAKTGLKAGVYTLLATDSSGYQNQASVAVYEPLKVTATSTGAVSADGTATLTVLGGAGTGSYAFAWTRNGVGYSLAQNLTDLDPATYACRISSAHYTTTVSVDVTSGLLFNNTPSTARFTFAAVAGASAYRITYTVASDPDTVNVLYTSTLQLSIIVPGLLPTVTYTFNVVGSSRVDLQACKLEYSIVSPK